MLAAGFPATSRRGSRRVAGWWDLADGRAESPLETRPRLLLADAGLAPEELQCLVFGPDGRPAARLDLAWPSHRLDVERRPAEILAAVGRVLARGQARRA